MCQLLFTISSSFYCRKLTNEKWGKESTICKSRLHTFATIYGVYKILTVSGGIHSTSQPKVSTGPLSAQMYGRCISSAYLALLPQGLPLLHLCTLCTLCHPFLHIDVYTTYCYLALVSFFRVLYPHQYLH